MTLYERRYNGRAMRQIKRILDLGRSEPETPSPALLEEDKIIFSANMLGICLLLGGLMLISSCNATPAHAEITDSQAIKILVGEASNQGFKGMVCVAEVLRRTGSTKGFYGLHASHSAHESKSVWKMAGKAWEASKTSNFTHGADHFENIHAFGCPYWVKNCIETFRYRDHVFYKEVA